jgi:L,D-peptidoglycan transpeptidase YkuD (ErfK/YbiS/YcfS/YnhG family)
MRRADEFYRLGVIVDHNADRVAGCGSCIFLHIWSGAGKGTAGCTAMEAPRMEAVLRWLEARKRPLLVQLPRGEFERLKAEWDLPARK